eukprot:EST47497.1 Hypothetical protein SS50377_12482 [Spironucleus salmonicida]
MDQNCIFLQTEFFQAYPDLKSDPKICQFQHEDHNLVYVPYLQHHQKIQNIDKLQQQYDQLYKDTVETLFILSNNENCTIQDIIDQRKYGFELQAENSISDD